MYLFIDDQFAEKVSRDNLPRTILLSTSKLQYSGTRKFQVNAQSGFKALETPGLSVGIGKNVNKWKTGFTAPTLGP